MASKIYTEGNYFFLLIDGQTIPKQDHKEQVRVEQINDNQYRIRSHRFGTYVVSIEEVPVVGVYSLGVVQNQLGVDYTLSSWEEFYTNNTGSGTITLNEEENSEVNIHDPITTKSAAIDTFGNVRTANTKRIVGNNFGSTIDTNVMYNKTENNGATVTASNAEGLLTTGTTANGNCALFTKTRIRHLSGRSNNIRIVARFGDTGGANNVREFGVYVDATNLFVFRLSGTTFSIVLNKNGTENTVSNGSFNGDGSQSNLSFTVDTNYHKYEIMYNSSRIIFVIDSVAIHTFTPTNTSLLASLVGTLYASNANSGGSTTSRVLGLLTWSGSQIGDSVNNPLFYNIAATAETRTLKGGGGTLHAISIGKAGGANSAITLYDNTAGSGTIIGTWDLTKDQVIGTHNLAVQGVNFNNGLTYTTSGTMTGASITIFWE